MFESLESRQFFSVTLGSDVTSDVSPPPADTVYTVESKKPKPRPSGTQQTYYAVTLENVLVSSY
jgi:hypothetical protein